jgi:putative IMPACT (imprinted ancient) family translation regulator
MGDRVVVLRSDDPLGFVADACAAVAELVNETHLWHLSDQLATETYAELLVALANLVRPDLITDASVLTRKFGGNLLEPGISFS